MNSVVSVRDLSVAYDHKPVLWDIDLEIPAGRLTAIVGPNGAGKSTLIKSILGMMPSVSGTITVFNQPVTKVRKKVAYVPQRNAVDWEFPTDALDVVMMGTYGRLGWFRRPGKAEQEAALESLGRVGMADFARRQISQLSGGQQQRVFLARALVQKADLFFMDEPLAGVDTVTEESILGILKELRDEGKTVVVVHHDLQTVEEVFDDVILLNVRLVAAGSVAETLNPDNLRAAYGPRMANLAAK